MKKESKNWLAQARSDFAAAKYTYKGKRYDVAAFLCQQATEKALKAVCIERFNELVKVHDLVFLGKKVDIPEQFLESCELLTKIYTETRYPVGDVIPSKKFSKDDIKEFLKRSQEVLNWVKKTLSGKS